MPRIPDYVAQVGAPDIGQTPSAANGGQAVGAGLQALGGGLQQAGDDALEVARRNEQVLQARQQKQQAFDDDAKWDLYRAKAANALTQAQENMPEGASGFASSFMKSQEQPQADLIASISPANQGKYRKLLSTYNEQTSGQASQLEYQARGTYETGLVNNAYQSYLTGIARDPNSRDAAQADLFQKIDNTSSLTAATKADMKQKVEQGVSQAQWQALYGNNPTAGAAAFGRGPLPPNMVPSASIAASITKAAGELGTTPQDLAAVIAYESGFSTSKWGGKGGNYMGLIQFGPEERKQYGVKPGQPFDEQMQAAVQFLKDRGFKPGMGLLDLYSTVNAGSPGHYDANDGHGTVAQHVQRLQASMQGRVDAVLGGSAGPIDTNAGGVAKTDPDPRFSSITLDQQNSLISSAQRTFDEQQAKAAQQQKLFVDSQENQLQNALQDGNAGMPEINQARQQGWLVDADKVAKFEEIVAKRDKDVANVRGFFDTLNSGGRLNPYSSQDQDKADAAFKSLGGDMAALDTVFQTGIMPKSGAVALRGALASNNAGEVQKALTIATNAMQQNPNAFTGVEGGKDIEQQAQTFDHLINSRGMPMSQAVAQIQQMGTPEYRSKIRVADDQVKEFQKAITPDTIAPMFASMSQGSITNPRGTPALGADPSQQAEMLRDFREAATQHYQETGDGALAQQMAKADMDKVWGVTNFLGTPVLAKFPVEKTYPPVNADPGGPYAYVERQAGEAILAQTGRLVLPQNMVIAAQMPAAAQAYYKGQPAPYTIGYTAPDANGFPVVHTLPGAFYPDPAKGHALASQQIAPAIDAQSARDATRQQMSDQLQQLQRGMMGDIVHPENNAPIKAPVIKPPSTPAAPVPGKAAATPTGNDAFQQLKNQVEGGGTGGDGFGGSGVGM